MLVQLGESVGASGLADALKTGLTADAFFGSLAPFVGVIVGIVIFAFAYHILRRVISGASKGKPRV